MDTIPTTTNTAINAKPPSSIGRGSLTRITFDVFGGMTTKVYSFFSKRVLLRKKHLNLRGPDRPASAFSQVLQPVSSTRIGSADSAGFPVESFALPLADKTLR